MLIDKKCFLKEKLYKMQKIFLHLSYFSSVRQTLSQLFLTAKTNIAFICAIFFALGLSFSFLFSYILFFLLSLLCLKPSIRLFSIFFLAGFFYGYLHTPIALDQKILQGKGYFIIHSYQPGSFKNNLYCKGTCYNFQTTDGIKYKKIDCSYATSYTKRLKGNIRYLIEGQILCKKHYCQLKNIQILEQKKRFSLIEIRYLLKRKIQKFLSKYFSHSLCRNFILAFVTGELNDNYLRFCFSRLGLSHILAISGLHFSLLLACLFYLLRNFIPYTWICYFLLFISTVYYLFIGNYVSVQRAWIMTSLFLLSQIIQKNYHPLNTLGVSMLICLVIDPLSLKKISFQLSYLSVLTIILFYPIFSHVTNRIIKKRSPQELQDYDIFSKSVYYLLRFLVYNFIFTSLISLILLPTLLLHFHSFPIVALFYNLFLPAALSVVLLSTFILLALGWSSWLCSILAYLINAYCIFLLHYVTHFPIVLNIQLRVKSFSVIQALIGTIFLLFLLSIGKTLIEKRRDFSLL